MRISCLSMMLLLALAAPAFSQSAAPAPIMNAVEPAFGSIGDQLTARGTGLGENAVAALYLTDGRNDTKVVIIQQTATSIKFKIPPSAKAGRFSLMVLTRGDNPKLIEEPVKVTVEGGGSET